MARAMKMLAFIGFLLSFHLLVSTIPGVTADELTADDGYDYSGDRGPEHWGELKEEWKTCGTGQQQSPINIVAKEARPNPLLGSLQRNYHPANATLKNRGHDLAVEWPEANAGKLNIAGFEYTLLECHWHHPAEHTLDNRVYPLELHMVHQTDDGKIAVLGIIYQFGKPDKFLTELRDDLIVMAEQNLTELPLVSVNPMDIKIRDGEEYYRYNGSLTTPPCDEGVIWSVIKHVRTVTWEQIDLILRALHHGPNATNARPVQPTNGRIIELYTPPKIQAILESHEAASLSTF